jgi:hypothetical protein
MRITTRKKVQIFSDGSLNFDTTIIKKLKKINFFNRDHKNFVLNKKNSDILFYQQNSKNFKTKYLKFN